MLVVSVLIILASFLTLRCEACPPNSRVIQNQAGCRVCECCRRTNGDYYVQCRGLTSVTIPNIPPNVTHLDLTNTRIQHLNDESFPWLPKLTVLNVGYDDKNSSSLKTIHRRTFENLPKLKELKLLISLENVTDFLGTLKYLRSMSLRCFNRSLTRKEYKTIFRSTALDYLETENCNIELNENLFENAPTMLKVVDTSEMVKSSVNLRSSAVDVYRNTTSLERCLDMEFVYAEKLRITCQTSRLALGPRTLDWLRGTTANVTIRLLVDHYVSINLGNYRLRALEIHFVTTHLHVDSDKFIDDLSKCVKNASVGGLVVESRNSPIPRYGLLRQARLRQLLQPATTELRLTRFRIGQIDRFDYTLTVFECAYCVIFCENCFKSPALGTLVLEETMSTIRVDLNQFLIDHPNMEKLVLSSRELKIYEMPLDIRTLNLPYHPRLKHLKVRNTIVLNVHDSVFTLNVSGLVNLETLSIGPLHIHEHPWQPSGAKIIMSNLKRLVHFELNDNKILPLGSLAETFLGLDALASLHLTNMNLMGSNSFWKTVERLESLLIPVSRTLEVLNLTNDAIDSLSMNVFAAMSNLKLLDLSQNKLKILNINVFKRSVIVSQINLAGNQLEEIDNVDYLLGLQYLRTLDLGDNQLICSCSNRKMRDWIFYVRQNELVNISYDELCPVVYGRNVGVKFVDFTSSWLDCDFHLEEVILVCALFSIVLIIGFLYALYYFKWDIIFWWNVKRSHRVNRQHSIHPARKYHAFLSYSSSEQLLATKIFFQLEEGKDIQFRIAYDHRDFLAGFTISDNIVRCIDQSEKVLFLISREFLRRDWTTFELNFAQMRCFDEKKNVIILIFVEKLRDRELPKRIRVLRRHVNYLEYPDESDSRAVQNFWHRLRLALAQDTEIETRPVPEAPQQGNAALVPSWERPCSLNDERRPLLIPV